MAARRCDVATAADIAKAHEKVPAALGPVDILDNNAGTARTMAFENISGGDAFIGTCPDCGSQLEFAEGCVKCHVCGFSECG